MSENKYQVRIARDETRSMNIAERMWYKGTAKWVFLAGLGVLAVVSVAMVYLSLQANPVPEVKSARVAQTVVERNIPHFYVVLNKGSAEYLANGSTTWQQLDDGTVLQSGDSLKTGKDTYVTLISHQDSVVRLGSQSEVLVNDVSNPTEKLTSLNLRLEKGRAWSYIAPREDETVDFSLSTSSMFVQSEQGVVLAFSGDEQAAGVLSGEASVKEIKNSSGATDSILSNSVTHESTLTESEYIELSSSGGTARVEDFPSGLRSTYWYKWNKEQDELYRKSLDNALINEGPPLEIDQPVDDIIVLEEPHYTVTGRTSIDARIFVNNRQAANNGGEFSYKGNIEPGVTDLVVQAIDRFGNRTVVESTMVYGNPDEVQTLLAAAGRAIELAGTPEETAIRISWNKIEREDFGGYFLVRSTEEENISYPKNEAYKQFEDRTVTEFVDQDVEEGTTYFYRLCAGRSEDRYDCSNVVRVAYTKPEVKPFELVLNEAEKIDADFRLTWTAYDRDFFERYLVLLGQGDEALEVGSPDIVETVVIDGAENAVFDTSDLPAALATGEWRTRVVLERTDRDPWYSNEIRFTVE